MAKSPKDVVRRFLDEGTDADGAWNMDVIDECFSPEYWSHTWQGDLGHTGARQGRFFSALEHLERLESVLIAEDEWVVHRSRSRARHVGELFGLAPTGRVVTLDHVEMWRVDDGKIVEHWGGIGAGAQLHRALTVGAGPGEDVPSPEELVGKDELDEDDEMELDGDDLDEG
jgi:predicted ester cyclase